MDIEFFKELIHYEYEKEWIEFKENWYNREEIKSTFRRYQMLQPFVVYHTLIWYGDKYYDLVRRFLIIG